MITVSINGISSGTIQHNNVATTTAEVLPEVYATIKIITVTTVTNIIPPFYSTHKSGLLYLPVTFKFKDFTSFL